MKLRRRSVFYGTLLAVVSVLAFGGVSPAAAAKITAAYPAWSPTEATINAGQSVEFESSETTLAHGVGWGATAPETPSCTGVPGPAQTGPWSGSCTFNQAGSYPFHCTLHASMTGTITVNSTGPSAPTVTPEAATNIKAEEATLKGSVNPNGASTTYWFEYGIDTGYGQETTHVSGVTTTGSKSATVSTLTPSTVYHFRMVAQNSMGTTNGGDRTFTTAGPPTATTDPAASVGSVQATLKGTVNPKGLETKYFFNYGTTEAYGQNTAETALGSGSSGTSVSKVVTGLAPETEYHFQIVAKNSAGEAKGADRTFTTTGGPLATTGQAAGIGEATATLVGVVNPQGQQTGFYFNYGTTTAYGQKTAEKAAGAGTSDISVSESVAGLSPGTTYHFQVVAKNAGGTVLGSDQTFTTGTTPPPLPPPTPTPILEPGPTLITPATPETKITKKPPAKVQGRTATIKFSSSAAGSSFECKLDGKPFKACRSPYTAKGLKPGKHKFQVRALAAGVADPSPATASFKVLKP